MLVDYYQKKDNLICHYYNEEYIKMTKVISLTSDKLYNWGVSNETNSFPLQWNGKSSKKTATKLLSKFRLFEEIYNDSESDSIFCESHPLPAFVFLMYENKIPKTIIVLSKSTVLVFTTIQLNDDIISKIELQIKHSFGVNYSIRFKHYGSVSLLLNSYFHNIVSKFKLICSIEQYYDEDKQTKFAKKLNTHDDFTNWKNGLPDSCVYFDYNDILIKYDKNQKYKDDLTPELLVKNTYDIKKVILNNTNQNLYSAIFDICALNYYETQNKLLQIPIYIATISKTPLKTVMYSTQIGEHIMFDLFLKNNLVYGKGKEQKEFFSFVGGLTTEPKKQHANNVVYLDFKGMYLSLMRQFNISPDSYIKKINDVDPESFVKRNPNKILTTNGTIYKKEKSLLSTRLDSLASDRDTRKLRVTKLQQVLNDVDTEIKRRCL